MHIQFLAVHLGQLFMTHYHKEYNVSTSFLGSSNKNFTCTRRDKTLRESDICGALCESELEKYTI